MIKLYDKEARAFKLNDLVTFIGVLEFSVPVHDPHQDSQMTEYDQEHADLPCGVPNEDKLPRLHVITHRRNLLHHNLSQLPKQSVATDYVQKHSQTIREAHEKFIAVIKLILGGDKLAAEFTFLGLISKVYLRETGLLIGGIMPNISGISK